MPDTIVAPPSSPQSAPAPVPGAAAPPAAAPASTPAPPMTQRQRSAAALRALHEPKPESDNPVPRGIAPVEPPNPPAAKPDPNPEPTSKPAAPTEPDPTPEQAADLKPLSKDGKKASSWDVANHYKKAYKANESKIVELERKLASAPDVAAVQARADKSEARLKELSDEIRHVNYARSDEFKEKYQAPYEAAWGRAIADMKELSVILEDGSTRPGTPNDLLTIANMPLGEARATANKMFGDAADDVMAHYRSVRELSAAQEKALVDARKTSAEREKTQTEGRQKMESETVQLWNQFKSEDEGKYDFLKPKEGDEEWNSKLESARKFVDGSFSTSVTDPKLTPDQRAEAVRKHAAVRGRAIAYTMMRLENKRLQAEVTKANKALGEYKAGEPSGGTAKSANGSGAAPVGPTDRMSQIKAGIRRLAS